MAALFNDTVAGKAAAKIELRYSPLCRTAWAKVTLLTAKATVGRAVIRRNDGYSYSCFASDGKRSCYTPQVYDGGYKALAEGSYKYQYSTFYSYYDLGPTPWY